MSGKARDEVGAQDSVLARQMDFYARTAEEYDSWHVDAHDEHFAALRLVAGLLPTFEVGSLLDVGCGTGRALSYLVERMPSLVLRGTDPSRELLDQAVRNGIPRNWLDNADGYALPYSDGAFDAVLTTGVLHHVERPGRLVSEMMRVARKAIFISDTNTYGMGQFPYRLLKVAARALNLQRPLSWLRYGGHVWFYSAGDGVAFPYSIFDSSRELSRQFKQVLIVPTAGSSSRHGVPLLSATHALMVATDRR